MEVIVYTSASCSACRTVKEFLGMHHVPFEERNLQVAEHQEELGEKYGAYSAPSVVVDGELVEGGLPEIAAAVGVEM